MPGLDDMSVEELTALAESRGMKVKAAPGLSPAPQTALDNMPVEKLMALAKQRGMQVKEPSLPAGQFAIPDTEQMTPEQRQLVQGGFLPNINEYREGTFGENMMARLNAAGNVVPGLGAPGKAPIPLKEMGKALISPATAVADWARGKGKFAEAAATAEREAGRIATEATATESAEQAAARMQQYAKAQEAQDYIRVTESRAEQDAAAQMEKIRAGAEKKVTPQAYEEVLSTESGHSRAAVEAAPSAWLEAGPSGAQLPSEAKIEAVAQGRDALFYKPYERLSGDLKGQYAAKIEKYGAQVIEPAALQGLKDAVTEEMKYSATSGRTFAKPVQDMFARVEELTSGTGMPPLPPSMQFPGAAEKIAAQYGKASTTTASQVFTLQSEIGELMRSGRLSGTDKTALQTLDMAAHGILNGALPIPEKLKRQYALMKGYYDRSFMGGVREATNPAMGAAHLLENPERGMYLAANMNPAEKGEARKAILELYLNNPGAVVNEQNAKVFEHLYGKDHVLSKPGTFRYIDKKLENFDELMSRSPAASQRMDEIMTQEAQGMHAKLARTAVKDVRNWIGKLEPQQGAQLKRELAALPDDVSRARRIRTFWQGDVPEEAMQGLKGQQRPPESAGAEAIQKRFPAIETPQTGQFVEAPTTPAGVAERTVRKGLPEGKQGYLMRHAQVMLPIYGTLAAYDVVVNHELGWPAKMAALGAVANGIGVWRGAFAASLEDAGKAAQFVRAMHEPTTPTNLRTIARYAVAATVKRQMGQLPIPHDLTLPPPPPQAPLPETPKKERIDTVKEIRAGIQEGGEPVNVTTDLHAGRVTIDDLREQLAPPMPGE